MSDEGMNDERLRSGKHSRSPYLSLILSSLICLSLIALPLPAHATPLVADLSNYRIDMDSGFNGTRIFLFGARNDTGDVVAVIRGPYKDYIVRRKEEIAGIWVNRERMKFFHVPDFYAVAASRPLADIEKSAVARRLGIGQNNLLSLPPDPESPGSYGQFADAFLRHQRERKLYSQQPDPVTFMGETLFKTMIAFPDNIPPGDYSAEIYLLSGGDVVGMQSTPIRVVKSGMDAFLYMYAHDYPVLYGISAVVMALCMGWFVGRAFSKV